MSDLFNNTSNSYIDPALAPCRGSNSLKYLEFIEGGIGIVSGSTTLAKLDFSDLSILVNSWNQQLQIIQPGEVVFVQGLSKGLTQRRQVFPWPESILLTTTNIDLNQYFMEIDLSINYYDSFSYTVKDIDASSNYAENIAIDTALSLELSIQGIGAGSIYSDASIEFLGNQAGYQYNITNAVLTIIDTSENILSPFPNIGTPQVYNLEEDASLAVSYANYPNTAEQGIVMYVKYPSSYQGVATSAFDKWIDINHVPATLAIYTPITLEFDSSVNSILTIAYDGSTFLGIKYPISDASIAVNYDVSIGEIINNFDASLSITNAIMDGSTLVNYEVIDSSILNSSITYSDVSGGYIATSNILDDGSISYISNATISDSSIGDAKISSSTITNTPYINDSTFADSLIIDSSLDGTLLADINYLLRTDVSGGNQIGYIEGEADASSYKNYKNVLISAGSSPDIKLQYYNIENIDGTPAATALIKAQDSSLADISNILSPSLLSISESTAIRVSNSNVLTYKSKIEDSEIIGGTQIQDTSVYRSSITNITVNNSLLTDSSVFTSTLVDSTFVQSRVWDASINNTIFNQDTSVSDSSINNSWSNVYVLGTTYVMEDDTLEIDTSAWRVNINNSLIWDSSFNNATIRDCSIYSSYFQDSSIIGCTTYNCIFEDSTDVDTKTVMIDASILCDSSIFQDTSTYYDKTIKTIEVGMSGCSTDDAMSAGDYLEWVTDNDVWNKVGDMYIWTSAVDNPGDPTLKNLINGFYVFNPHLFPIQIEYIVFV